METSALPRPCSISRLPAFGSSPSRWLTCACNAKRGSIATTGRRGRMTTPARLERIATSIDLPRLTASRGLVVGLGSGGSTVALELAKSGIGHLILCDPDRLEEHNLVRHECDERYLGESKPRAV